MICARCLRRVSTFIPSTSRSNPLIQPRFLSTTPRRAAEQESSSNAESTSKSQRSPPAATSTSAAQPFSTAETPSPQTLGTSGASSASTSQQTQRVKSCVPAGTVLKGLNYFKNKDDPIAREDHEYPDWLWEVLYEKKPIEAGEEAKDPRIYAKSARSRRAANKRARKQALERGDEQMDVPIYEQSIDLEVGDDKRRELTRAMREKRRKDIKEQNFLRAMR